MGLDSNAETAKKFVEDREIQFPVLVDSKGESIDLYGVNVIPLNFIIDGTGSVVTVQEGYPGNDWLIEELEAVLGEPLQVNEHEPTEKDQGTPGADEKSARPRVLWERGGAAVLVILIIVIVLVTWSVVRRKNV